MPSVSPKPAPPSIDFISFALYFCSSSMTWVCLPEGRNSSIRSNGFAPPNIAIMSGFSSGADPSNSVSSARFSRESDWRCSTCFSSAISLKIAMPPFQYSNLFVPPGRSALKRES